ncbi:MAG: ribosome maturation factor RimP [Desulfobulbaceae bacterium]|nr:ribosome maturation factor RimP [Desulfobulbaceae bacterium]
MSIGTENIIAAIEEYAGPVLDDMGLELVEVQFRREGHGWVLRIFVDREQGVTIDDCARVSREISTWLDVEDLIEHAYHLEVSSPGLERPLKKPADYERFAGRMARIKLKEPRDNRRVFTGILESIQENEVTLIVDDEPVNITFEEIARARLTL